LEYPGLERRTSHDSSGTHRSHAYGIAITGFHVLRHMHCSLLAMRGRVVVPMRLERKRWPGLTEAS